MEEFKDFDGRIVDLDDINIYPEKLRNIDVHDLFSECMDVAGSSLFYMNYLHPCFAEDIQEERVKILCWELADIWDNKRKFVPDASKCTMTNEDEYRWLLLKWWYRFTDETENQC